ncbi:MAG: hypothetical protein ABH823_01100 [bacterium]
MTGQFIIGVPTARASVVSLGATASPKAPARPVLLDSPDGELMGTLLGPQLIAALPPGIRLSVDPLGVFERTCLIDLSSAAAADPVAVRAMLGNLAKVRGPVAFRMGIPIEERVSKEQSLAALRAHLDIQSATLASLADAVPDGEEILVVTDLAGFTPLGRRLPVTAETLNRTILPGWDASAAGQSLPAGVLGRKLGW